MNQFNITFYDDTPLMTIESFKHLNLQDNFKSNSLKTLVEFALKNSEIIQFIYFTEWSDDRDEIEGQVSGYELTDAWNEGERPEDLSFF